MIDQSNGTIAAKDLLKDTIEEIEASLLWQSNLPKY
jgi:hypothetical protein